MPRPTVSEETLDRIEETVDQRTKVPAKHLTTEERLAFVLDELEETEARASRLADRVEALEAELQETRSDASGDGFTTPRRSSTQYR